MPKSLLFLGGLNARCPIVTAEIVLGHVSASAADGRNRVGTWHADAGRAKQAAIFIGEHGLTEFDPAMISSLANVIGLSCSVVHLLNQKRENSGFLATVKVAPGAGVARRDDLSFWDPGSQFSRAVQLEAGEIFERASYEFRVPASGVTVVAQEM